MPIQLLLGFEGFLTVFAFVAHQVQSFVCSCVVVVDGFVAADFALVVAPHVFGQQVVRSFADFFRVVKVFSRRVPFVSRTRTKFRRKIFIFELSLFFDLRFYDSVGMIYICESEEGKFFQIGPELISIKKIRLGAEFAKKKRKFHQSSLELFLNI